VSSPRNPTVLSAVGLSAVYVCVVVVFEGELMLEEFRGLMKRADLGMTDPDILALANSLDEDGNMIIVWREFIPLALTLIDAMEAQNSAVKERLEKTAWAEAEAAELEGLYLSDLERLLEQSVKDIKEMEASVTGILKKEILQEYLEMLPAPPDPTGRPEAGGDEGELGMGSSLLRQSEVEKVCRMLECGKDGDRAPLVDLNKLKATVLDVRFTTVKLDLLEMSQGAIATYLLERAKRRALQEETEGEGCGVEGAVMLTKPLLQEILIGDQALCLQPLQVLSILRLAKAVPLPEKPGDPVGERLQQPKFVDCTTFIPLAAAAIECFFDPKFLVRRSEILKRACLRPVELLRGPDRRALEERMLQVLARADRDQDGGLDHREFIGLMRKLDLGLGTKDMEELLRFADADGDGVVNPEEFFEFAFSSLLHLLREQALQRALEGFAGDPRDEGAAASETPDLAGNEGALVMQSFVQAIVAKKVVKDLKETYGRGAATRLLRLNSSRKAQQQTPTGVANLQAAVATFTQRATAFNAAKDRQLNSDLAPDLPVAQSLFPEDGPSRPKVRR